MFKGKLAVLGLVALSLLVVNGTAFAGIIDPCLSQASIVLAGAPGPSVPLQSCPQGDTGSLIAQGWYIDLTIVDGTGTGQAGISPTDFWLIDCDVTNAVILCGGSASSGADSLTNALGETTMSNTSLAASNCGVASPAINPGGGAEDGMRVIVQGFAIQDEPSGCLDLCLPIQVRSVDYSGDGLISLADLGFFALGFPPNPFDTCADLNGSGTVTLADLGFFALHFGPPGHSCN